jgi:hypothetical protein
MSQSYRIRTQVGVDKSIKVLIEQDFDFLQVLSLKISQSQIYTRPCSDYGVIIGRVTANDGFGIPNAKVSIFIPLTSEDEENPVINDLYPYKTLTDLNEDGYRYNLLPYEKQHSGHNPTGTFFTREDVLTDTTLIEVFDKYFRYTARTNESGDYMIFGVPVGSQTIHVDVDLSDIGEFSLSPQDLIRMGVATSSQVSGTEFKSSSNLNELPQIITINRTIEVEPLWGQTEICNIGITRTDFDLTSEANINITPTAIFMGSIISSNDDSFVNRKCKPKLKSGNLCNLVTGFGEILAIRQTILQDENGRPILETISLGEGGQVIDDNGTWLIDVPMNLDYVVTNEFGERVLSNDPKKGIPTSAKYRFKVKWNQEPTLNETIKRGYFLVPNVKEWGWVNTSNDPLVNPSTPIDFVHAKNSYAFSLDWNDYGDTGTTIGLQMIQEAIVCEDRFYPMVFNKVYTVSQMIDQYRKGFLPNRMISIKNIMDDSCESENTKFPTNDAVFRLDLIYLLFVIMLFIFKPIIYILIIVVHVLAFLLKFILGPILAIVVGIIYSLVIGLCFAVNILCFGCLAPCPNFNDLKDKVTTMLNLYTYFTNIPLPNLSYPDCELCDCKEGGNPDPGDNDPSGGGSVSNILQESGLYSVLSTFSFSSSYNTTLSTTTFSYPQLIGNLLAGQPISTSSPSAGATVPQLIEYNSGTGNYIFTNSLTIAERMNLFNNKSKFFDSSSNNPGGGVNKIKVTFQSDINPTKYHFDNVIAISVVPTQLSNFTAGKLISFQDPSLTKDINLTGVTSWNQFGTSSITGTPININTTIQIPYANPNGTGTISPPNSLYTITQDTGDTLYHKFAMDVEYFQVITGMTYSDFATLCNPGSSNQTLNNRFLNNSMRWDYVGPDSCWISTGFVNPLTNLDNYVDQGIVFMVRGVDPNTSRRQHSYDLSILFGYPLGTPGYSVTGQYKMNWPIQGSYKSVSHTNMVANTTNTDVANSTGQILYYDSFHFQPAIGSGGFSSFTSNLPSYYSSLDRTIPTFTPTSAPLPLNFASSINPSYGVRIYTSFSSTYNGFQTHFDNPSVSILGCTLYTRYENSSGVSPSTKGYYNNEIVDGGSLFLQNSINLPTLAPTPRIVQTGYVYAPRYSSTLNFNFLTNVTLTDRKIIMRSDRLPLSTTNIEVAGNSFALHGNPNFVVFYLDDNGVVQNQPQSSGTPNFGSSNQTSEDNEDSNLGTNVLETFTCQGMIPLECYQGTSGEIQILPPTDPCYTNKWNDDTKPIMDNGCYILVSSIFGTLVNGRDFGLLTEWLSRIQITFAACQNVWSQIFTNNWINGTLYAFSFKNDRFFTGPTATPPNSPYSVYCKETIYLHPTNNFYYRCSPYKDPNFIGANAPTSTFFGSYGGNNYNLKYPTTILDLGPRNFYTQELVMSDDYDGYVVNRLNDTSFTSIDEILNLLIISRLINTGFLASLFGAGGASALSYFDKRSRQFVDGDYAQAVSVSSELGISDFESINYPNNPFGQDPIYISDSNAGDVVIGIFYSSDTQLRDFISPKRTIIVPTGSTSNPCTFNSIKVFSQVVPFYQWEIKTGDPDNIFGSQKNDWYTQPLGSSFLQNRYQSMDRLQPSSRYFRNTIGNTYNIYNKGYIYAVSGATLPFDLSASVADWNLSNTPQPRVVTVGAPFYFYFGLKKGKTAFDRFARQWIKFEVETD